VNVTIGDGLLKLASFALKHEKDPQGRQALEVISGLKAIYVRSYEFPEDNMYSKEDVESVRAQLSQPGWSPLAQIRQRLDDVEDVDVYVSTENDKVTGFAIVATCPRKFTIVNIVGSIDVEKLAAIEDRFGLADYKM
jgi:predicted P-loop ATPase